MRELDIEMDEEEMQERVSNLTEDQQNTLRGIMTVLVLTLESEEGCAVVTADINGRGRAAMLVAGNSLIAPQLTYCAADVMRQMDDHVGEMQ